MEYIVLALIANIAWSISLIGGMLIAFEWGKKAPKETPVKPQEAPKAAERNPDAEIAQQRMETVLRNLENYNGTSQGQEEVR